MKSESVRTVLDALGSFHSDPAPRINSEGTWSAVSCPLAPWTHTGSGKDRNPSMMVSVEPGVSACKCLSCGFSGGLMALVKEVETHGGIDAETNADLRYFIILAEAELYDSYGGKREKPDIPDDLVSDLNTYHPYWQDRGISRQEARLWGLGYSGDHRRALIPFWGEEGSLLGIVGRDVSGISAAKYRVYPTGFDRSRYLFGAHRVLGDKPKLLLVEGYLDVIAMSRYVPDDVDVVGLGTASPSKHQLRRLAMLTHEELIVGLDNDDAGAKGWMKLRRELEGRIKLSYLDYGEYNDADEAGPDTARLIRERNSITFSGAIDRLQSMIPRY